MKKGTLTVKAAALVIWALLLFAPFLFQDVRQIEVAARIAVFIVLVASYDLLIGYTGIVSFAHTMFFGVGAYGVAIALKHMGAGWGPVLLGTAGGVVVTALLAVAIGLLSLRVKAIFFAMITLAAASVVLVLASQLSGITGGEDGMTYKVPELFKPATKLFTDEAGKVVRLWGVQMNGKLAAYYFVFVIAAVLFWAMLRIVGSPLGTVLKAIRENEGRAEGIGYRVVAYRTAVFVIAAVTAALAGSAYALWLKYTGPETVLSFGIMIDILLMVVIGGMGTMWGAVIGATALVMAQYYLRDLMEVAAGATAELPLLPELLNPERWLLWLGIIFILLVYFFPAGIAGTIIDKGDRKAGA
ncbi:branched-chain amino acid ABC transporter permease [Seohaeicola zhoushanensis]|uniref:Branched-chain amino acid ABC transporter permease n=1 Tax=Seohaeicola zhoushanensis TaxID=1569283 RepID=A0A8J3GZJ4_9RHOB|nr:branched-chain amino acid ABC transporter permease [Seohaeicola zhoushanensis]GHF57179.1 branched-chain amino acid ABC transporter permease [Seohaeicola zhoushanensis]